MTIQQWLFSFKGRIGRRDFWIWIGLWFAGMLVLFSLAGKNLLDIQTAAFCLVCLLWPTAAVNVKGLCRLLFTSDALRQEVDVRIV